MIFRLKTIRSSLEVINRPDTRGVWIRTPPLTVSIHGWSLSRYQQRPLLAGRIALQVGRGAGYLLSRNLGIPGVTAYLGWRATGGLPLTQTPPRLRAGVTTNGNRIPYHFRAYR